MLLWRLIKRNAFMNQEFRKYLWYAAGEIVLVVVGILIALQIDAWYGSRQNQERLQNYLNNIARTITDDLAAVKELRSTRGMTIFEAYSAMLSVSDPDAVNTDWYGRALVASTTRALSMARDIHYVSASAESFRALESSGLIGSLSDPDLEFLLHDYYRTIGRIVNLERDMNDRIAELSLRFQTVTVSGLPSLIRREPLLMWDGEFDAGGEAELPTLRRLYWEALVDPTTFELLRSTISEPLMRDYEHLLSLGTQLVDRIRQYPHGDATGDERNGVFDATSRKGHPDIVANGIPGYHSYAPFTAPAGALELGTDYTHARIDGGALHITYDGGLPWAYFYFRVGPVEIIVDRLSKDFSRFKEIQLELKRAPETACSSLVLEIKDVEDAEKGGLTAVALPLTTDWQTFTFELSQFAEADPTDLHVVAGFLMGEDACEFAIRSIYYR